MAETEDQTPVPLRADPGAILKESILNEMKSDEVGEGVGLPSGEVQRTAARNEEAKCFPRLRRRRGDNG